MAEIEVIRVDEDIMACMLRVPPAQIPEEVLAEYRIRLRLWHCAGGSGPLGIQAILAMLRQMKLGKPPVQKQPPNHDWSRVPTDGSVRVVARYERGNGVREWLSGAYQGQIGASGKLAVLLDGDAYVREFRRDEVRVARDEPMKPIPSTEAKQSTLPLAEQEPWVSMPENEVVMVQLEDDDLQEGHYQGIEGDEVLVVVADDLTPKRFRPESVTVLERRLAAAGK